MFEIAYRVPFIVHRSSASALVIQNTSQETLKHLRLSLSGEGVFWSNNMGRLAPGESAEVKILGNDLAKNSLLVLRWFRDTGEEYLWQVSFP